MSKNRIKIEKLCINPEYRGFGYGKILLNYVEDYSIKEGFTRITLGVDGTKESLYQWYLDFGFILRREKVIKRTGTKVFFMELSLDLKNLDI